MSDETLAPATFRLITAASAGFPLLYRYQPFDHERLSQLIGEHILYFSNPADFNDPWDCRPWFDLDQLADPDGLNRHIQWYETITRRHRPDISEDEICRRSQFFRSNPTLLRDKAIELTAELESAIHERYRVYCLGSSPDSELMWAHYAARHTGICLEFATRNALFCGALQVSYRQTYPLFDLTADEEEHNLAVLLTKSTSWSYEGEYRLIAQEKETANVPDTLVTNNHRLAMPEGALSAVIVGCLAPEATLETLRALVRQSRRQIAVKRAMRARNQYKLTIVEQ